MPDIAGNVNSCVFPRRVDSPVYALILQGAVPRLRPSIVITNPGASDRALHADVFRVSREVSERVLRSSVAVKDRHAFPDITIPGGHAERIGDQLGAHVFGHRVADDLLGEQSNTVARYSHPCQVGM